MLPAPRSLCGAGGSIADAFKWLPRSGPKKLQSLKLKTSWSDEYDDDTNDKAFQIFLGGQKIFISEFSAGHPNDSDERADNLNYNNILKSLRIIYYPYFKSTFFHTFPPPLFILIVNIIICSLIILLFLVNIIICSLIILQFQDD